MNDPDPPGHGQFVADYRAGRIRVHVDRARAARFLSARMMLPFMLLPLLGGAVALALSGRPIAGIALFVATLAFRYLVRATSQGFVLLRALDRAQFYREAVAAGVLQVVPAEGRAGVPQEVPAEGRAGD